MPFLPLHSPPLTRGLQLVVTLGPASLGLIPQLAASGATAFRLNASHLDPAALDSALARVRECCPDAQVVVDLQGAKMRIDLLAARDVTRDQSVRFALSDDGDVRVPHAELFEQARIGDTLSVDDGRLRFDVVAAGRDGLNGLALNDGRLLPRKGVNLERHPVRLQRLTARDADACRVAARHHASALAFSFMTDGAEAAWVRTAVPGCRVVAKVERLEAVERLQQVAERVDEVWICRGDLGAQLGLPALARLVAAVEPAAHPVPFLMAGQVLEHLTCHPEPTRSEVCHLFDLVARGYAGIVLSDETAIGADPVHAVSTAARLLADFRS